MRAGGESGLDFGREGIRFTESGRSADYTLSAGFSGADRKL